MSHKLSAPAPSHRNHSTISRFSHPHTFKISILSSKAPPKAVTCILLHAGLAESPWIGNSARFMAFVPQFVQCTSQGIKKKPTVYPDTVKEREHEIISLILHFTTNCKAAQSCYSYRKCMLSKISKNITQAPLKSTKDKEFATSSGGLF